MEFSRDKDQYVLSSATIATSGAAKMHWAKYLNPKSRNEVSVGIKIVDINKIENIYSFTKQIHRAETCDHENMVKVHCSFKVNDQLWIVMPPLSGFSSKSTIRSSFPNRLPENTVSFILKEILKALDYMHGRNKLHLDISADCIFLDEKYFTVKLAYRSLTSDKATDIWMFGLLALELFYGRLPASDFEEFQFLLGGIEDKFGILSKKKECRRGINASGFLGRFNVFSPLGEVMASCLMERDPKKRPTTNQPMEFNLL
ncbi:MEKK [Handroanthus impetiginosus]|uniref:MEKK n=1 Tax=Handroanthus impetiginosus TaxID=429701 RepID=A0A2G9HFC6_9LAMI|nr:MEKK [Handroanthus impetiginosus]